MDWELGLVTVTNKYRLHLQQKDDLHQLATRRLCLFKARRCLHLSNPIGIIQIRKQSRTCNVLNWMTTYTFGLPYHDSCYELFNIWMKWTWFICTMFVCWLLCNDLSHFECNFVFTIQDAKRILHRHGSDDSIDSFVDYGTRITDLLDSNMAPGIDFYLRCLKCGKDFKSPALITSSELITCRCGSESIGVIETA